MADRYVTDLRRDRCADAGQPVAEVIPQQLERLVHPVCRPRRPSKRQVTALPPPLQPSLSVDLLKFSSHWRVQSGGRSVGGLRDGIGRKGHPSDQRINGGRRGGRARVVQVSDGAAPRPISGPGPSTFDTPSTPHRLVAAPAAKSASVGGDICSLSRNDDDDEDKKRRSSLGARVMGMVGLGKKSQSASQLNPEGESCQTARENSKWNQAEVIPFLS